MGYHLKQHGVVALVALVAVLGGSCGGQDLRPSDHGLAYQEASVSPPQENSDEQEMRAFFGGSASAVELPEAKNISDTWWSERGGSGDGGERDAGRVRVRLGFLVASAVCGLTGVLLLVISGVAFLLRLQKQKLKGDELPATSATGNIGQLEY